MRLSDLLQALHKHGVGVSKEAEFKDQKIWELDFLRGAPTSYRYPVDVTKDGADTELTDPEVEALMRRFNPDKDNGN